MEANSVVLLAGATLAADKLGAKFAFIFLQNKLPSGEHVINDYARVSIVGSSCSTEGALHEPLLNPANSSKFERSGRTRWLLFQ